MQDNTGIFKTIEELAQSNLSLDEKIKQLPILIISNNSNTRDGIGMLLQKKGYKKVMAVKDTHEAVLMITKKGINNLLKFSITDLDIGEKYFYKSDFNNLPGLDAESFWKNCIEEKIMTIIGDIGVPLSYDDFIRRIKKFGTVDENLGDNMKNIQQKVKIFDTKLFLSLLQQRNVISEVKSYFIIKPSEDTHFIELNKQVSEEYKDLCFNSPIKPEEVCEKIENGFKQLMNKYQEENEIENMIFELPLTEAQKKELMTNFQMVNSLIDTRAESIAVKYKEKIDYELIKNTKRQVYKIMTHYAVKNELHYFQYFSRGMKGVFTQLENEMKFSDIRQAFLFKNVLSRINSLDYQTIKDEIKQCGIIVIIIINNFLLMEKNKIETVKDFDQMLFYRALGIVYLWADEYTDLFLKILKQNPNYYDYFLTKENQKKQLTGQDYQNLYRRFLSFTDKVYQVDKCTNVDD